MSIAPEYGFRLNVRVPADATRVSDWLPTTDGRSHVRLFDGTQREAADVRVDILGAQYLNGSVPQRWIVVGSLDASDDEPAQEYDASAARRLANEVDVVAQLEAITDPGMAADGFALADILIAAADEIDGQPS